MFPDSLDIVIPAYKQRFLPQLLESLEAQTSRKFRVIVADDASPERIDSTCEKFADRLPLRYVRFERNLGSSDLVSHWNRSVALSDAKWLLVPGDDDVLEQNCVAAFWQAVHEFGGSVDVLSYGVRIIDDSNRILEERAPVIVNSAAEFIAGCFAWQILPMPVGYIFSRSVFDQCGGFVSISKSGWYSDDATWALFAARRGIAPIRGAYVRWRRSTIHISAEMPRDRVGVTEAKIEFASWMLCNARRLRLSEDDLTKTFCATRNYWSWYPGLSTAPIRSWLGRMWRASSLLSKYTGNSLARHLYRFARARWGRCTY